MLSAHRTQVLGSSPSDAPTDDRQMLNKDTMLVSGGEHRGECKFVMHGHQQVRDRAMGKTLPQSQPCSIAPTQAELEHSGTRGPTSTSKLFL